MLDKDKMNELIEKDSKKTELLTLLNNIKSLAIDDLQKNVDYSNELKLEIKA